MIPNGCTQLPGGFDLGFDAGFDVGSIICPAFFAVAQGVGGFVDQIDASGFVSEHAINGFTQEQDASGCVVAADIRQAGA